MLLSNTTVNALFLQCCQCCGGHAEDRTQEALPAGSREADEGGRAPLHPGLLRAREPAEAGLRQAAVRAHAGGEGILGSH